MSAEHDPGVWAQVAQWLWVPVGGLVAALWGTHGKRLDDLEERTITQKAFDAHCASDEKSLRGIDDELSTHRGHIGKVFDKLSDLERQVHRQHVELLNAIHNRE